MFTARPAAKVNLTLEIGPPGDDGYHPLRSVFLRVGLADKLTLRPTSGPTDRMEIEGIPGAPVEGNICLRAVAALRERAGLDLPPLALLLEKRIPVAAGLGGGSSDAAAALKLAQACWGIGLSAQEEGELAIGLGSDVPFFVADAEAALVEGRGEIIRGLPPVVGEPGVLLVSLPIELSTRAVFARHDLITAQMPAAASTATADLVAALDAGLAAEQLPAWAARLREANDLWPAAGAVAPSLPALREELESRTARPWLLSGSGPTLFALYPSAMEAVTAGELLAARLPSVAGGALIHVTDLRGPDPAWRYP